MRWLLVLSALALASACAVVARPHASSAPEAAGVPVREASCAPGADADADGLADACELAIARAFAPELRVDPRDCLWSGDPMPRLRGAYLFAVQPVAAGAVRIAYLPAYAHDCGWRGVARALHLGRRGAHAGDSELVLVDVVAVKGAWRATGVFLSAHCLGGSDGRCRWYRGAELARFTWRDDRPLGAPRIWVASGKHAHYPSRASCERGHWMQERCARRPVAFVFPVATARQNVGSRARPAFDARGCITARALPLPLEGAAPDARECIWDGAAPFRGWHPSPHGRAATSHGRLLRELGAM